MNPVLLWRLERDLTLEQLAEKSGINKDTISRIENGRRAQARTLKRVADALNVSILEFQELITEGRGPKSERPAA